MFDGPAIKISPRILVRRSRALAATAPLLVVHLDDFYIATRKNCDHHKTQRNTRVAYVRGAEKQNSIGSRVASIAFKLLTKRHLRFCISLQTNDHDTPAINCAANLHTSASEAQRHLHTLQPTNQPTNTNTHSPLVAI